MKSSFSLVFGVALVAGGWASMPGVAFADATRPSTAQQRLQLLDAARAQPAGGQTITCHGDGDAHVHASGCTCAQCTAASPTD